MGDTRNDGWEVRRVRVQVEYECLVQYDAKSGETLDDGVGDHCYTPGHTIEQVAPNIGVSSYDPESIKIIDVRTLDGRACNTETGKVLLQSRPAS